MNFRKFRIDYEKKNFFNNFQNAKLMKFDETFNSIYRKYDNSTGNFYLYNVSPNAHEEN